MSLRKFVATVGLYLLLNAGCAEEKKPASPTQQPQKSESTYENFEPLARKVAGLSEKVFPGGGIINYGKNNEGLTRYLAVGVLNEEGGKALELRLYMGTGAETEARVNKLIDAENYDSAITVLEASGWGMSAIHDSGINGLDPTDPKDYATSRGEGNQQVTRKSFDLYAKLGEIDGLYKVLLQRTEPILEERTKEKK